MIVPRESVPVAVWRALEEGAVVHVRRDEARFVLRGRGALACVQGLVTCDVEGNRDGSRTFGALLTNKGMIVTTVFITRHDAEHLTLETPAPAGPVTAETLRRSLPPRLCTFEDVTTVTSGLGVYGPRGVALLGEVNAQPAVSRGAQGMELSDATERVDSITEKCLRAGAVRATDALLDACRILAGIPALGSEIDDRTLPQEVRLDELGAVSYTKGCYVGQETVARLHFRGHANRRLVAVGLDEAPTGLPRPLVREGKAVGRLTSAAWADDLDRWFALAVVRHEVPDGGEVELEGGAKGIVRLSGWMRRP